MDDMGHGSSSCLFVGCVFKVLIVVCVGVCVCVCVSAFL